MGGGQHKATSCVGGTTSSRDASYVLCEVFKSANYWANIRIALARSIYQQLEADYWAILNEYEQRCKGQKTWVENEDKKKKLKWDVGTAKIDAIQSRRAVATANVKIILANFGQHRPEIVEK